MTRPFESIRVIDLSNRLSGAFTARLFGDYGADVILAEPAGGHCLRHEPPFLADQPGAERSVLHSYVNWNKRSVSAENEKRLARLIETADVVVTTATAHEEAPFPEALRSMRKDAVHLTVTAHGYEGPLSELAGNNLTASARTGWAYINGYRDEPPLQMPGHQNGYVGGLAGFVAAGAALLRRDQEDVVERVDVSEVEALALTVHPWAIAAIYEGTGWSRGPAGGRLRGDPGPLYKTSDGRMNFGFGDWHNWPDAMRLIHLPELAERADLQSDVGRHTKDMSAVVAGAAREVASLGRWDLFHSLSKIRCQCGVVQDIDDILHDKQLAARGFLVETDIEGKRIRAAGAPAKLDPSPWELARRAPKFDEHSDEIGIPAGPPNDSNRGSSTPSPAGPLSGIRVLSFTQAWSGTFGTELLSLLGADVVQIESLHRIDVWRRTGARVPTSLRDPARLQHELNTQGLYNSVNLNKRAITLDLRQERGWEIFWKMVPDFDIVAENFRPGVLPKWGVTLESLAEKRPGVILASISGYGSEGPYADYPANGATTEPMSGFSSLLGYEGGPGMSSGGLYPDPIAAYCFASSIIAALHHRDRTGDPQRIDLSMLEAMTIISGDAIAEYDATGRLPRPMGNRHKRIAPHNIYDAAGDESFALAAETDEVWEAVANHIGGPELASDSRFASMGTRKEHELKLDEILAQWCSTQNAAEAESVLGALGATVARVVPLYELYSRPDPNLTERGFIVPIDHPETGVTMLPGRPWRMSGAPHEPLRPSPCVGEHSESYLRGELGISADGYAEMVATKLTGTLYD